MTYVPIRVDGRTQMISLPDGAGPQSAAQYLDERKRAEAVERARSYYEGTQYDAINEKAMEACQVNTLDDLPEHERVHNYSTHVSESVNFVADQLSAGFTVKAEAASVQAVLDAAAANTDALTSDDDDVTVTCDAVLTESLVASDVPYEVRWNPFTQEVFYEFWESENVEFDNPYGDHVERVTRREKRWVKDDKITGQEETEREVEERVVYDLQRNELGYLECVKTVYWDEEEEPRREPEWLGLPIIPWGLLRAQKEGLRAFRGVSYVSEQIMTAVRRFDALEQYAFQIARYNSHGNLVTVGDAAALQIENNSGVKKDVADVVSFPEGTKAFALQLPTDPDMIEHQRKVLEESIYKKFGLTRVEPDTLDSLGQVSGYALEILNRKSAGTLNRITRQWKKDWTAMANLTLDVYAYRARAGVAVQNFDGSVESINLEDPDLVLDEDTVPFVAFWEVDPAEEFPDRAVDIQMGSGYIVDDVMVRDDFTSRLISRREALRKRGYEDPDIEKIERELREENPLENQVSQAGRRAAEQDDQTEDDESDTGRGSLGSTARDEGTDQ